MRERERTHTCWVEVTQSPPSIKKLFPYKLFQCYFVALLSAVTFVTGWRFSVYWLPIRSADTLFEGGD